MKVLSLFDGMSCGMLAMMAAGVSVDQYDAYEIDKYAVTASKHNFPQIEHHGDVFKADFTAYCGYDFLIGGSPCTYWSIAQRPDKRETVASGLGWELFIQYVRALREAQPRMFIYENNKSMSKDIRASITETFGFEPICINSALVSAQNRQRLYWVGVRNEDGTYRKASIEQPADRGILLKDVLDSAQPVTMDSGKGYALTASYGKANAADLHRGRNSQAAEPLGEVGAGKAPTLKAQYAKNGTANFITNGGFSAASVAEPAGIKSLGGLNNSHQRGVVYDETGKTPTLVAGMGAGGGNTPLVSEPACVASRGRNPDDPSDRTAGAPTEQRFEAHEDGKTNTLTSVGKDNLIAEPQRIGTMPRESDGEVTNSRQYRIYSPDGKAVTQTAGAGGMGAKTGLYATQEKPKREQRVYEVKDGMIEVNGKRYPIKLRDGRYIIRKLTVTECMRLQTVPEWYDFSCVSNTQAYKMLGNGWTVEVIAHLIRGAIKSSIFGT